MTPTESRRLHVLLTNSREYRVEPEPPHTDWLLVAVWTGILTVSTALMVGVGVITAALVRAAWEMWR